MSKRKTISISFEGSKDEIKNLRRAALDQGTSIGKLVRDALSAQYPSFFESHGSKKGQANTASAK